MRTAKKIRQATLFFCVVGIIGSVLEGLYSIAPDAVVGTALGKIGIISSFGILSSLFAIVIKIAFCVAIKHIGSGVAEILENSFETYQKTLYNMNHSGDGNNSANNNSSQKSFTPNNGFWGDPSKAGSVNQRPLNFSNSYSGNEVVPYKINEDIIECPKCSFRQKKGKKICFSCGASFKQE